mmetsp:Transcript_33463/g.99693  ORF Transcript_33463/g.99693 Transcript_33463/m.99693 type:complete len:306 (-) Transcript_33463:114-1031(-)
MAGAAAGDGRAAASSAGTARLGLAWSAAASPGAPRPGLAWSATSRPGAARPGLATWRCGGRGRHCREARARGGPRRRPRGGAPRGPRARTGRGGRLRALPAGAGRSAAAAGGAGPSRQFRGGAPRGPFARLGGGSSQSMLPAGAEHGAAAGGGGQAASVCGAPGSPRVAWRGCACGRRGHGIPPGGITGVRGAKAPQRGDAPAVGARVRGAAARGLRAARCVPAGGAVLLPQRVPFGQGTPRAGHKPLGWRYPRRGYWDDRADAASPQRGNASLQGGGPRARQPPPGVAGPEPLGTAAAVRRLPG